MKEMFADNPRFKLILPIIGEKVLLAEYILPEPKLEDYGLTEKDIQNRDSLMQLFFK